MITQIWNGLTLDQIGLIAAFIDAFALAGYFLIGDRLGKTKSSAAITTWGFGVASGMLLFILPIWNFPTEVFSKDMELEMNQWNITSNQRIMNEEIIDGDDRLGVLLMGHPYKSWWTGSLLNIHDSRKLIPKQSATTVQVSSAVYAAVAWAMANPNRGYMVPDDMPWREVLGFAQNIFPRCINLIIELRI